MLVVATTADLSAHVGQEVGVSAWREIPESMILGFGALTDERHWIHTDAARVRRETPFDGLVAHGFLTLALLTTLGGECLRIEDAPRILNYGIDRLRFTEIVTAGARIRLRLTLRDMKSVSDGSMRLTWHGVVEVQSKARPALVCDFLWLIQPN